MSVPWVWSDADLFFLSNSLRQGMSLKEVAGFLGRTVEEVRAKAQALHLPLNESYGSTAPRAPNHAERRWPKITLRRGARTQRIGVIRAGAERRRRP